MKPYGALRLHRNKRRILMSYPFDLRSLSNMQNRGYGFGLDGTVLGTPAWGNGPDGWEMVFAGGQEIRNTGPGVAGASELDLVVKDGTDFFQTRLGCSIRIRFRTTTASTVIRMFEIVSNSSGPAVIFNYPSAGQLKYYFNNFNDVDALDSSGTPALNDGRLHEVVLVRYRDNIGATRRARIYVDGKLDAQRDQVGVGPIQDGGGLHLGTDSVGNAYWHGRISLFEIHNHPLAPAQIASYWADPWQDYRPPDYARMALVAGEGGGGGETPTPGEAVNDPARSLRRRSLLKH